MLVTDSYNSSFIYVVVLYIPSAGVMVVELIFMLAVGYPSSRPLLLP